MHGTFLVSIDGTRPVTNSELRSVQIMDPDGLFDQVFHSPDDHRSARLALIDVYDLKLGHGSKTPSVFSNAPKLGLMQPSAFTALRLVAHHVHIFRSTFYDGKRVESCLVGIEPLSSEQGRKYILEVGLCNNAPFLRFRRADDDEMWPDYEYWVFET